MDHMDDIARLALNAGSTGEPVGSMQAIANHSYPSLAEAEKAVYSLAMENGFAAVKKRVNKDSRGQLHRIDLECSRGSSRPSKGTGKRQTPTARCNCPWKAMLKLPRSSGGMWIVGLATDTHNHPKLAAEQLPTNRRRQQRESGVGERMARLSKIPELSATDIARTLRMEFPDTGILSRDIQNRRQAEKFRSQQRVQEQPQQQLAWGQLPANLQQQQAALEQQQAALQRQSIALHRQQTALEEQRAALSQQQAALRQQQAAFQPPQTALQQPQSAFQQQQPAALPQTPTSLQQQPAPFQQQPAAVPQPPASLQQQPGALQQQPVTLQ